jgi:hypothetical protein
MTDLNIEIAPRAAQVAMSRPIAIRRIRFTEHPVTGTRIRRTFKSPRPCLAVEQTIEFGDWQRNQVFSKSIDSLDIVYVPAEAKLEWEKSGGDWLMPTDNADSLEPVTISILGDQILWRPGRVIVQGNKGLRDEVVSALIEFAFHEGEVRALEKSIENFEAQARLDAPKAFSIEKKDRQEWPRFRNIMESLAQLRLTFAKLKPHAERGSRMLGKESRVLATRLLRAAEASRRMEGLDGRLEACEDLYEGALDRITDYRGWHTGHMLEVFIIVLLLIEAGIMAVELVLRSNE